MIKLKGYKIFISSPRDVTDDKKCVEECINKFNKLHAIYDDIVFIPFTSNDYAGGQGRAQGIINEKIEKCDYLIVMFHKIIGYPSGECESGTVEEYELGKKLKAEGKIKEILLLFKEITPSEEGDPGAELKKVIEFRGRIEKNRECWYKLFEDEHVLKFEIEKFLKNSLSIVKGDEVPSQKSFVVSDVVGILPEI